MMEFFQDPMNQLSILLIITAYLLGSFPSGLVIGKLFAGKDIREYGSKNIGTTNAIRVLGKKLGLLVFLLDVMKVAGLCLVVKYNPELTSLHYTIFGYFGLIGHMFPIFAGFKGGKIVASGFGVSIVFIPIQALIAITIFFIVLKITKYVSVSSMIAAIVPVILLLVWPQGNEFWQIPSADQLYLVVFSSFIAVVLIIRHHANIARLINGTEKKIGTKKQEPTENEQ